MLTQILL